MSVSEDAKDFALHKGIRDRVLELQQAGLVIPKPPVTDTPVAPEETAPFGYITVKTQTWKWATADKISKDSFNPTAVYRWTRADFEISRRPRVEADGDLDCVYVYPPAPKPPYEEAERRWETMDEWRSRVYREGPNGNIKAIGSMSDPHPRSTRSSNDTGSKTPSRGFLLG